jgi:hypothetical protein
MQDLVDFMLGSQLIIANPEASEWLYLHHSLNIHLGNLPVPCDPCKFKIDWVPEASIYHMLLAAGCRTDLVDAHGNTAMSLLLRQLLQRRKLVPYYFHLFRPLSQSIDIEQQNDAGGSVATHLEDLLNSSAVYFEVKEFLQKRIAIVKTGDGQRRIEWLTAAYRDEVGPKVTWPIDARKIDLSP